MFHFFSARPAFFSVGNYNCKYYLIRHEAAISRLLWRKLLPASSEVIGTRKKKYKQLTVGEAIIGCANHGASDRRHNAHRLSALVLHLTIHR